MTDQSVQIYDFEPFYEGETCYAANLTLTINGTLHDFTGSKLYMHIRARADSPVISEELTSDDGDMTISGTLVTIIQRDSPLLHGSYVYSILEKMATDSVKRQRFIGKITVLEPPTKI